MDQSNNKKDTMILKSKKDTKSQKCWTVFHKDDDSYAVWSHPLARGTYKDGDYTLVLRFEFNQSHFNPLIIAYFHNKQENQLSTDASIKIVGSNVDKSISTCHSDIVHSIVFGDYVSSFRFMMEEEDIMTLFRLDSQLVFLFEKDTCTISLEKDESLQLALLKKQVAPGMLSDQQKESIQAYRKKITEEKARLQRQKEEKERIRKEEEDQARRLKEIEVAEKRRQEEEKKREEEKEKKRKEEEETRNNLRLSEQFETNLKILTKYLFEGRNSFKIQKVEHGDSYIYTTYYQLDLPYSIFSFPSFGCRIWSREIYLRYKKTGEKPSIEEKFKLPYLNDKSDYCLLLFEDLRRRRIIGSYNNYGGSPDYKSCGFQEDAIVFRANSLDKLYDAIDGNISAYDIPIPKKGCYVATCVYGSYDCPEVWTLRRFRDQVLDESLLGRLFIKIYYAISPKIVRWLGDTHWFRLFWRERLDRLVGKLRALGYDGTPYSDKY